mmetsp:Transcript_23742/g.75179  ORF Transcript_23742/g.75179 Transcript_23742/m.75179 type:complete len:147 (+) Transcript_23742:107-547(+)
MVARKCDAAALSSASPAPPPPPNDPALPTELWQLPRSQLPKEVKRRRATSALPIGRPSAALSRPRSLLSTLTERRPTEPPANETRPATSPPPTDRPARDGRAPPGPHRESRTEQDLASSGELGDLGGWRECRAEKRSVFGSVCTAE